MGTGKVLGLSTSQPSAKLNIQTTSFIKLIAKETASIARQEVAKFEVVKKEADSIPAHPGLTARGGTLKQKKIPFRHGLRFGLFFT